MAKILATTTRDEVHDVTSTDESGFSKTEPTKVSLVTSVTFHDYQGTPHTLTFHPKGTIVSGADEPALRVVGEDVPYYEYDDPEKAVQDYLDGKV